VMQILGQALRIKAQPAPRATRVPAVRAISGTVIRVSVRTTPSGDTGPTTRGRSALAGEDPAPQALCRPEAGAEAPPPDDPAVVHEQAGAHVPPPFRWGGGRPPGRPRRRRLKGSGGGPDPRGPPGSAPRLTKISGCKRAVGTRDGERLSHGTGAAVPAPVW